MPSVRLFTRLPMVFSLLLGLLLTASAASANDAPAADEAQVAADITAILHDFLANVGDAETHARYWASDLVYTSAAGEVKSKPGIMESFQAEKSAPAAPAAPGPSYSAEDILVRPFGDSAALTFRLVAHAADGGRTEFRNSGMFVHRDGQWQVVTWQATRVPAEASQ